MVAPAWQGSFLVHPFHIPSTSNPACRSQPQMKLAAWASARRESVNGDPVTGLAIETSTTRAQDRRLPRGDPVDRAAWDSSLLPSYMDQSTWEGAAHAKSSPIPGRRWFHAD